MDPNLSAAFVAVCGFCKERPNMPANLPQDDPRAEAIGQNLDYIAEWLRGKFPSFKDVQLRVERSKGAGAFPLVPWVAVLPPGQDPSNGIYAVLCFGKNGAGAVTGCASSGANVHKLVTVTRKTSDATPVVDVDGSRPGTRYNNLFANPREILLDEFDESILEDHINKSLKIAAEHLAQQTGAAPSPSPSQPAAQPVKLPPPTTQILHGPPGTGKTYTTIRSAVILADRLQAGSDKATPDRFKELRQQERIQFITFHQSYGYEDFIEGIRPDLGQGGETLRFKLVDGVFKRMATIALFACLRQVEPSNTSDFAMRFEMVLAAVKAAPQQTLEIPGLSARQKWRVQATSDDNIRAVAGNAQKKMPHCSRNNLSAVYDKYPNRPSIVGADVKEALSKGTNASFVAAIFNHLRSMPLPQLRQGQAEAVEYEKKALAVQAFLKDEKSSGYTFWDQPEPPPNYVLVIDEINRGNISKIFGELITLIEDDKRVGAEHVLLVTLATSRELFGVPPNLHLVGTMNTADKSIALLDVALRRRFTFKDLPPDFEVCKGLTPPMRKVLAELNDRIERRKDRDHRIGHAFFKGVEADQAEQDFDRAFREKVVPLLQEYFFNDFEGARYVLGEVKKDKDKDDDKRFIRPLGDGGANGGATRWRWFLDYKDPHKFACFDRLTKNYAKPVSPEGP